VPAIAVADALRAEGATVTFAGTRDRAEAELVPGAGYEIDFLRASGISRSNPLKAAVAVGRAVRAVGAARRILRERRADAVLGGGGYVAGPVGRAALREGLPLVLTEADSHLGLANRLLAGRARRVCLAFPIEGREGDPYLVTGRPIPRGVREADRNEARARFGIDAGESCLTVFGGSLGARSVNEAALGAFLEDGPERVLHVTGRRDHADAVARWDAAGSPSRYTVIEYEPDLGDVLAACDLVVARAGGSILEVAAAGRPAILIPYPHATGDHQTRNAAWMERGGAAVVLADRELSADSLRVEAVELLGDPERLARMAAASERLARPDAAERIAAEVLSAVRT
jgi:UDP-N-acetylglucosamine--N-acetylmuramyl-(pentapeptide) pyrophosphoryl-undecaprenol N-acetylglucosamine transferase